MGINANMQHVATLENAELTKQLLIEAIETNRLLRIVAGEPEPEYPASAIAWSFSRKAAEARKSRKAIKAAEREAKRLAKQS